MEVGEKTSKRGFAVNRCIEFILGTRYVPSRSTSEVKVILGCCWLRYLRKEVRGSGIGKNPRTSLTCLNALLVDFWTIPSILNLQSRRFLRK